MLAHVRLPADYAVPSVAALDSVRARAWEALQAEHSHMVFDMVFTAGSRWIDGGLRNPAAKETDSDAVED